MKITLYSPANNGQTIRKAESLGIRYLASIAEQVGYSVQLLDSHCWSINLLDSINKVSEYKPSIIGIQIIFSEQLEPARLFCKRIKKDYPEIEIILGGHVVTFSPKAVLLKIPEIAFVFIGEAEKSFEKYLKLKKESVSCHEVDGVAYYSNGKYHQNKLPSLIKDLDTLPYPKRYSNDFVSQYHASVTTSRGCVFNCSFCSVPAFFSNNSGSPWRLRSIESVIYELKYLKKNYGVTHISFIDDIFVSTDRKSILRAKNFSEALIREKLQLKFSIECRVESINLELFSQLKLAGLQRVLLGLESGNNDSLSNLNKKTSVALNEKAISVLKKLNIDVAIGFIMFEPNSTLESLKQNLQFLRDNYLISKRSVLSRLITYPGTQSWRELKENNRLIGDELNPTYDFEFSEVTNVWEILKFSLTSFHEIDINFLKIEFEKTKVNVIENNESYLNLKKSYSEELYNIILDVLTKAETDKSLSSFKNMFLELHKKYLKKSHGLLEKCLSSNIS